ncbi:MAG: hypothetical protein A2161_09885 [Candidatus Schekmanbacteria bacterium RBG_13_48_7]|uniref:Uncharacterized protein n=1 Tax=Candidatus Schekmanbacteria bacterium RBG_13_48_7 TaxID=1817878 RepID=A0A1F7RQZ1_9BACT|nr:MAG: hypothetical protein A2161_09885 [Candidatus Schekmanbacteria bacterium RBG_13_48_7]
MEKLFSRKVFNSGGIEPTWIDVIIASIFWGNWPKLKQQVIEVIASCKKMDTLDRICYSGLLSF